LSVTRPLALLLVSTFVAFPIYVYPAINGVWFDGTTNQEIVDLMSFSLRQVTRPFDIWSRYDIDALRLLFPGATDPAPFFGTKLVATLQSVLSFSLITLFILALRRRFRME
jgi:hypothetical protein